MFLIVKRSHENENKYDRLLKILVYFERNLSFTKLVHWPDFNGPNVLAANFTSDLSFGCFSASAPKCETLGYLRKLTSVCAVNNYSHVRLAYIN